MIRMFWSCWSNSNIVNRFRQISGCISSFSEIAALWERLQTWTPKTRIFCETLFGWTWDSECLRISSWKQERVPLRSFRIRTTNCWDSDLNSNELRTSEQPVKSAVQNECISQNVPPGSPTEVDDQTSRWQLNRTSFLHLFNLEKLKSPTGEFQSLNLNFSGSDTVRKTNSLTANSSMAWFIIKNKKNLQKEEVASHEFKFQNKLADQRVATASGRLPLATTADLQLYILAWRVSSDELNRSV